MSALHMKGTRRYAKARAAATPRKPSAQPAARRFLAVALLALAAAGIMTVGESAHFAAAPIAASSVAPQPSHSRMPQDLQWMKSAHRASSALHAITTFDMH
jgi:hypothetical protein